MCSSTLSPTHASASSGSSVIRKSGPVTFSVISASSETRVSHLPVTTQRYFLPSSESFIANLNVSVSCPADVQSFHAVPPDACHCQRYASSFPSASTCRDTVSPVAADVLSGCLVMAAFFTVTVQNAFFPPSFVSAVITDEPSLSAFIFPLSSTLTTVLSSLLQMTDLSVAFDGLTVAFRTPVSPGSISFAEASRLTPDTYTVTGISSNFWAPDPLADEIWILVLSAVLPPAASMYMLLPYVIRL